MNQEQIPFDIRLMNSVAIALMIGLVALGAWAALWSVVKHRSFQLRSITISGDRQHNSALTMRANVIPKLTGNFFTADLGRTQLAFEQVPWVRKAIVKRDFPNRLHVVLQEHAAVALFGPESESKLINTFGEVFEANQGDVLTDLPRLIGAEADARNLVKVWQTLTPLLEPLELLIDVLEVTPRGSWRATLDNGAMVELGRGSAADLAGQVKRFVATVTQSTAPIAREAQDLVSVDLRYPQGYSMRLRGVTTQTSSNSASVPNSKKQN